MNTQTHFFIKFLLLATLGISTLQWSFAGAPKTVAQGSPATINWNVIGGSGTCKPDTDYIQTTPDDGIRTFWRDQGLKSASGSHTFPSVLSAGSYTFSCTDLTPPNASDSVILNVVSVTLSPFTPSTISAGQSANISFTSTNAASCSGSGIWSGNLGGTSTPVGGKNTGAMTVGGTYTQTVTCTSADGVSATSATQTLKVVSVTLNPFSPSTIGVGDSSVISFSSTNAASCTGTGMWSGNLGGTSTPVGGRSTADNIYPNGVKPAGLYSQAVTCTSADGVSATSETKTLLVTNSPTPDLVADVISPITATTGSATTLSSTITNQGNASTGNSSFNNFIQVATAANGGGVVSDRTATLMSALAAGANGTTQTSYTFPSTGTYSARACADKTNSGTLNPGMVVESDDDNNCGSWTTITVGAGASASCTAGTKTWLTNCSGSTPLTADGATATVQNMSAGYTGSANYSCSNGTWSASSNETCSVTTRCNLPWGGSIPDGSSIWAYDTTTTYGSDSCSTTSHSESRTCNSGVLSDPSGTGTYNYGSCTHSNDCVLPWGGTLANGQTTTAYQSSTVSSPASCVSETRTCTNGTLSGGYQYSSCSVVAGATATLTVPACTIASNASTCATSVSWTSSNANGSYRVKQNGVTFSTSWQGAGTSRTLSYDPTGTSAANTFTASQTSSGVAVILDTKRGTATCASGTLWNGTLCEPKPDLTAGLVSPTSAVVNTATTFSAVITNGGLVSTGSTFDNFIQIATAPNGGGTLTDLTATNMAALAAGASANTSKAHTFTSNGTYYMRACADKTDRNTTTSNDNVNESEETNNCGAWTTISVGVAAVCSATHYACTSGTSGNNTSNTNAYDWTCTLGASTATCSEVKGLSIIVNPTTYNTTLPTTAISATYSLTNGTQANTECTLLDYNKQPLGPASPCTGSKSFSAPSAAGSYDYYIRAYKSNVTQTATSSVFTVTVTTGVCGNGANNYPACTICTLPLVWDAVSSSCVAKPTVGGPTVTVDTTPPIQDTLDFTCSIGSTNYEILKTETSVVVASGLWTGTPISWPITTGYGNYQVKCSTGNVTGDPGTATYSSQAAGATTFTANPTTAKSGAVTTLVWSIATPPQTPACSIVATAVCTGGSCTSPKDDARTANATALTTSLASGYTDNNDPYNTTPGVGRLMSLALSQPTTKASGKKTIILQYTTDFTLTCPNKTQKVRVHVSNDNEG